jgi:thiol-disulfide isomerase/thioredoxin
MKTILKHFIITILLLFNTAIISAQKGTAIQMLSDLMIKIENLSSIEYQVTRSDGYMDSTGHSFKGNTLVTATSFPFRFAATLRDETGLAIQQAVSLNNVTKEISNGTVNETMTLNEDTTGMGILSDVTLDVATTWQFLLNTKLLRSSISSGQVYSLGEDEIDGDLCLIILLVDSRIIAGSSRISTYYLWLSKETGLPRCVQRYMIFRGRTTLSPRVNIQVKQLNPQISDNTFISQPEKTPTEIPTKQTFQNSPQINTLIGKKLPDFEIRDLSYKAISFAQFKGEPILINLWSPWCGCCVSEFPSLQKIQLKYKGKLNIIAIAVKDSRLNVLRFIKGHPEYTFTIVTDPEMQDTQSRLYDFFQTEGIPVSVFVNSSGTIIDRWEGFEDEATLIKRIDQLMKK